MRGQAPGVAANDLNRLRIRLAGLRTRRKLKIKGARSGSLLALAQTAVMNADNREVKHDVYGKRQTAKMKLLPSVFSSQYSRIKIFVSVVNSKRHFSIFV